MLEHGFEEEEHNSHLCTICLHYEHTPYSIPKTTVSLQEPEYFAFAVILTELTFIRSATYDMASPRAPPLFS